MEASVLLRVRQADVTLVESILPEIQDKYKEVSKKETHIKVDQENFIQADGCGGVELYAAKGNHFT